jgi:hypothetical protein
VVVIYRDEGISGSRGCRSRDIDLYLRQQCWDTSTPSGRALFGMLGVFSEFERGIIRDRVMAGVDRVRAAGRRLGRPRTTPYQIGRTRAALDEGPGVGETARLLKVSPAKVSAVRRMSAADAHPWKLEYEFRGDAVIAGEVRVPFELISSTWMQQIADGGRRDIGGGSNGRATPDSAQAWRSKMAQ